MNCRKFEDLWLFLGSIATSEQAASILADATLLEGSDFQQPLFEHRSNAADDHGEGPLPRSGGAFSGVDSGSDGPNGKL